MSSGGSCTMAWTAKASRMPTGTLMRKTQRQLALSVIQPPSVGPIAGAKTTAMP